MGQPTIQSKVNKTACKNFQHNKKDPTSKEIQKPNYNNKIKWNQILPNERMNG